MNQDYGWDSLSTQPKVHISVWFSQPKDFSIFFRFHNLDESAITSRIICRPYRRNEKRLGNDGVPSRILYLRRGNKEFLAEIIFMIFLFLKQVKAGFSQS